LDIIDTCKAIRKYSGANRNLSGISESNNAAKKSWALFAAAGVVNSLQH